MLSGDKGESARWTSQSSDPEALGELGRATTAYHDAPPERVENARQEYEEALRRFNAAQSAF